MSGLRAARIHGIFLAGRAVLRYGALLASLYALVLARAGAPGYVVLVAVLTCLALVFVLGRRDAGFRIWAAYMLAFFLFAQLRALADETGIETRFDYVADLDATLFGGALPTLWLQEHLYTPGAVGLVEVASVAVYTSYYALPHLVALVLWLRGSALFGRYTAALLATAYAGLVASLAVPTAPPWLAGQAGDLPFVARIVEDVANGVDPQIYTRGYEVVGANPVAAMPSLHMAMTFLVLLAAWQGGSLLRLTVVAYACAMGFALVYTGEHYVVDLLAGAATAAVAWRAVAAAGGVRRRLAASRTWLPAPVRTLARRSS